MLGSSNLFQMGMKGRIERRRDGMRIHTCMDIDVLGVLSDPCLVLLSATVSCGSSAASVCVCRTAFFRPLLPCSAQIIPTLLTPRTTLLYVVI
jgi:hypothetical protein